MIRAIAIVVLAIVALALGGAWVLLGTPSGAVALITFGAGWLPGELEVADVDGSFLQGIEAGEVVYRQEDITLVATDVRIAIDVAQLLTGTLAVDRAVVESVTLKDLPVDARFRLSGSARLLRDLPLEAAVEWVDGPSSFRGRGEFSGTLERLAFTHVVELPEPLTAEGTITDIVDAPGVNAVVRWAQLTLPEQDFGVLVSRDGEATIEATPGDYRVAATTQLVRNEDRVVRASLRARGDTERLIIDSLEVDGLGGIFEASGMVGFGEPPAVALAVSGRDFDPGVLLPGYHGRLSFNAEIDARWPERLTAEISRLDGEFLGSPVMGSGDVLAVDGALQRADVRLRSGVNKLNVSVTGQPRLAGDFDIDAPDLASLWPELAGELRGTGTLTGTTEAPRIAVDLSGANLRFDGQSIERLRIVGRADAATGVDFEARADGVQVVGQAIGDLTVTGSGTIEDHALDVGLSGGPVATRFDVDGSWDGKTLRERVGRASIDTEIGAWQLREPLAVTVADGSATVSAHCWDNAPASICIEGVDASEGRLSIGAALSRFPLQTLNPFLGEELALEGEADATLTFERDAEGFRAVVDWKQEDTRILFDSAVEDMLAESEVESRLSSLELRLVADEQEAELAGSVAGAFGLEAELRARLETPLEADGALSGALQAEVPDIATLRPLVDRYVPTEGLVGALVVDLRIGGTRDAPTLDGNARLRDAAATIPAFGITVEDVDIVVSAGEDDNLVLAGSARSGEGIVDLSGVIGVSDETGLYAEVALRGDRFQLVRLPDQSAVISPDVSARFDLGQIVLGGRVLVPEAAFQFVELGDAAVATSDDVVIHIEGEVPGEAESFARISGQLEIELGDAVTFEGLGLETRLTGGLVLTFRPGELPAGEGSFQLIDGTFMAFGREMLIERGSLNFYGPLDDPVVEARASRRIRYEQESIKVGIDLSGRVSQQLDFVLFSEPAMSEADVLSFMVVGRPAVTGEDGAASGAALALGLQSLTGSGTGEKLALDDISFEGGAGNDTAVAAGKRVGEKWYIRYTYGLFNRVGTFIIRYDIGRGVSVEAGTGAAQSLDLIYSIDR